MVSHENLKVQGDIILVTFSFLWNIASFFFRKYSLKAIVNVERNLDIHRGDRYLLELVFRDVAGNKIVRLSDFVYKFHNGSSLCRPKGMAWKRNTTVNVILTVKNQGAWAQHFVNEMSRICLETRDDHVNVIIVDYSSQDVNIEEVLKRWVPISQTIIPILLGKCLVLVKITR